MYYPLLDCAYVHIKEPFLLIGKISRSNGGRFPYLQGGMGPTTYHKMSGRNEGNVLFNDTLNTFYLQLYGFRHMVKDHSDSEREREREKCFI